MNAVLMLDVLYFNIVWLDPSFNEICNVYRAMIGNFARLTGTLSVNFSIEGMVNAI